MFTNYIKIAWRNIVRNKVYAAINMLGLALGICSCIVIFLITSFEFSFDGFHPDGDRIYRIVGELKRGNGEKEFLNSPMRDVAGFKNEIPGFEAKSGMYDYGVGISIPDSNNRLKKFDSRIANSYNSSTVVIWPEYFDIFKYDWLAGNAQRLQHPFTVVLTARRGQMYFGNIPFGSMIGKTIIYGDSLRVNVGGIVKDWTGNTDFGYTDFISVSTATHSFLKALVPTDDWSTLSPHQSMPFVKLSPGVSPAQINSAFAAYIKKHINLQGQGNSLSMWLQPLRTIHFTTDYRRGDDGDLFRKAYMPSLYILMGIALFILFIAAVNFINLSTAQSIQRVKEIGVRKVMGSSKTNILWQFMTETFVLTAFAVLISLLLVNPVLYLFKDFIPAGITFQWFAPSTGLFLLIITIITTLLAGFYPARVLAGHLPVVSLKGASFQKGKEKLNTRKVLIVFQFTLSLIFIIGVITIGKQLNFMMNADKGFTADGIITVNKWGQQDGKLKLLAENIRRIAGVDKVLLQMNAPMGFAQMQDTYKFKGKKEFTLQATVETGNEDYIPFYKMKLLAGRNMLPGDSTHELVINETLAKAIGFTNPRDAVGKELYTTGPGGDKPLPIVGVIADFHQGSFHDVVQPAVISNAPDNVKTSIAIKLSGSETNTGDVKNTKARIEKEFEKIFPGDPINYSMLNESIGWLYEQEEKTAWLTRVAAIITIFISSMGLFGLGMFTAQRRTKEIGIRKVLGASVASITTMLGKDFLRLVLVSICIASPVAGWLAHQWLQDFAFRTDISWWIFVLAGVIAMLIALVTIGFQAIKAATQNPVKSLRTE